MPGTASDIYIYTQGDFIEEDGLRGAGYAYTILTGAGRFEQAGPAVGGRLVAEFEAVAQALEAVKDLLEKKRARWSGGDRARLFVHVDAAHPDLAAIGANRQPPPDVHGEKFVHMLNNFRCGLSLAPAAGPQVELVFSACPEQPAERAPVAERARAAARLALVQNVRCDRLTSALDSLEATGVIPAAVAGYFRGPYLRDSVVKVLQVRQDPAARHVSSRIPASLPRPAPALYVPPRAATSLPVPPRRNFSRHPA